MLTMFRYIVWVDKYIIQIDHDTDVQEIRKKDIHELLEDYRSIGKTKEHYRPLKQFITCPKSSLTFITISDMN